MYSQISILRNHVHLAVEFGADFHELCNRLKISPEYLSDGESHAPWKPGTDNDFWLHALALTGVPTLGLQMGQRPTNNNAFGMLGLLATSCKNVREGIEMLCKYNDTLTGAFKFSFEVGEKESVFIFDPHPLWEEANLESARQAVDMLMSGWTKSIHESTGKKIYSLRTEVRYTNRFEEDYKQILKTPILFNQQHNCFIFSKEYLNTRLISYDESLNAVFSSLLRQKQKKLETRNTLTERIKELIVSKFNGQITHIDIVAAELCLTTRTLQRKLTEEQTSYRKISNTLRRELAHDLMKAGKSNKRALASLLGYSDVDAFNRAFKKTPSVF
jgi:AraC-like DNA-binding protein